MISLEFLLTSLIVVLIPGTGVIYTVSVGISHGFRASVLAALGCSFGIFPAAIAAIIGLSAILHTSALAFQIVKYLGVLYLFYLAYGALRQSQSSGFEEIKTAPRAFKLVRDAILLNVLNPKLSIFFLAFLPQFMPTTSEPALTDFMLLSSIFIAMTFFVFCLYGLMASQARQFVLERPKVMTWLQRSFAASFALLGIRLALSER